jgi:hypothetical protein
MQLGQLLYQRQPNAGALVGAPAGASHAMKAIEYPRQFAVGNADPGVLDSQNGQAVRGA